MYRGIYDQANLKNKKNENHLVKSLKGMSDQATVDNIEGGSIPQVLRPNAGPFDQRRSVTVMRDSAYTRLEPVRITSPGRDGESPYATVDFRANKNET